MLPELRGAVPHAPCAHPGPRPEPSLRWLQGLARISPLPEEMGRESPRQCFPSARCLSLATEAGSGPRSLLDHQPQSRRAKLKWKSKIDRVCALELAVTDSATCPGDTPAAAASTALAFSKPPSAAGLTRSRGLSLLPADPWVPQPEGSVSPGGARTTGWQGAAGARPRVLGCRNPGRRARGNRSPLAFSLA